jgi:hypothetical protein
MRNAAAMPADECVHMQPLPQEDRIMRHRCRSALVALAALAVVAAVPATAMAKQPAGVKQAKFKATLSGSQVTTWEYHAPLDQDDPCSASSDGYGDQTIRFDAKRKFDITFTAPPKNQPNLFSSNGRPAVLTAPILLAVDATADRNGDYTVNYHEVKSTCEGVAGGGGVTQDDKDCGVREGGFQTQLYFHAFVGDDDLDIPSPNPIPEKNNLKVQGNAYGWEAPSGGSESLLDATYKNCPMLIEDTPVERAGNIFTAPGKVQEKRLFDRKRKHIVVSGHEIVQRGSGNSTGQTILAWNLRLTRVR